MSGKIWAYLGGFLVTLMYKEKEAYVSFFFVLYLYKFYYYLSITTILYESPLQKRFLSSYRTINADVVEQYYYWIISLDK